MLFRCVFISLKRPYKFSTKEMVKSYCDCKIILSTFFLLIIIQFFYKYHLNIKNQLNNIDWNCNMHQIFFKKIRFTKWLFWFFFIKMKQPFKIIKFEIHKQKNQVHDCILIFTNSSSF